jgi:hypothetical protein
MQSFTKDYEATAYDLSTLDEIRKQYYPENILVPLTLYSLIITRQKGSTILVKCADRVVGYYAIIGLNEDTVNKLRSRQIEEKDLADIQFIPVIVTDIDYTGKYLYILSVVSKNKESTHLNISLLRSMKNRILYLSSHFAIKGVVADFYNPKIEKVFKSQFQIESVNK